MFRAQQNVFDDVVAKATDENLTSENWEFILDVCDKVNGSDSGGKDAVAAMIKRLAHRNANVQLYTLELANSLSQNCGIKMHRELSSKSFTDALLRLAGDRTTHQQVKSKILERMEEWSKMFTKNPELGIMDQAYYRLKSQNPNLQPPQAPVKRQITEFDRQKEEEELQMALKLSIQDNKGKAAASSSSSSQPAAELSAQPQASSSSQPQPGPVPSGTTAATVSRVRALFDFVPSEPGELQFRKGDVIAVLESVYKDWWKGSLRGHTGIFPLNYVEKLQDPTPDEVAREAEMEAEVFSQIKSVEKLLALLSTNTGDLSIRENEEITDLYHTTVAIRPKLIELIGKYTQKKDDLQQLNEKFIKARRDYESLLESSMAQSAAQYGRPVSQPYGGQMYPSGGQVPNNVISQQPPPQPYAGQMYPPGGQAPTNSISQYPPTAAVPPQAQFQPPYPVGSPPPQSQTPGASHTTQPPPMNQRRQSQHSSYGPQEMHTSMYDTPVDGQIRHTYPPQMQNPNIQQPQHQEPIKDNYAPSSYSPHETHDQSHLPPQQPNHVAPPQGPYSQQPPPQHQQQPNYPPQQPSYAPPAAPPDRQQDSQTPHQQQPPYSAFQPGQGPAGQQYQAYQPAPQQAYAGGGGGNNPASFYR